MVSSPDESDPRPQYTEEETKRLHANLLALRQQVGAGLVSGRLSRELLCTLHAALFEGVRDHAGHHRDRGWGSERMTFGPWRSVAREEVREGLDALCRQANQSFDSFAGQEDDPAYTELAFGLATWVQAEMVRIHPFEDGNGRTSRLLTDLLLVRLGQRPVAVEVVKEVYLACMDQFLRKKDGGPLRDLYLRLAMAALTEHPLCNSLPCSPLRSSSTPGRRPGSWPSCCSGRVAGGRLHPRPW